MERVYLTTPLYYVNAEPHLGHTYTTVIVDTLSRYHRNAGRETFFLTGTDEHGDKIAQAAKENGTDPKAYADRISQLFRSTWDQCGITYSHFIRTTDAYHVEFVQKVLRDIYDKGDIYFGEYGGFYCYGCERFYTEKELVDGQCPDHQKAPDYISEKNYFFRMGKYQDQLIDAIHSRPDFIRPERYRAEVLAFLREPLEDLCISRPKTRLQWGIPLPFDGNYVTYVWFDALLNYVSALNHRGEDIFQAFWPRANHFIAKDILKPHGIYWPTMLMAAGLPLYERLNVHGYWIMDSGKMSKSLGNVIRPLEMKERFGMDAFRYFLLREMAFGQDAKFSEEALVTRINADLANNLGNLVSRVLAMQQKYFAGVVQALSASWPAEDCALRDKFAQAEGELNGFIAELQFHRALEAIWSALDHANRYIVQTAPFTMIKEPAKQSRVGEILHHLLEVVRTLARLLAPFMPDTANELRALLALPDDKTALHAPWGQGFQPGHQIDGPKVLFPRIETDAKK
ncbi:MAG: methionine--tRNA ligase [Deltaproteobacteria bacterium]|nr:methionine--tRNA ligase [Deltaproteobacteria bacterium]MBI2182206.1 methionine--tRNA ligase [Deltaproteobacteria bacterium]MBI2229535.1 methionine--tRNA ligase [Deltaproteobacteria bacterium]MBI2365873.1 methionine--tRNA ligase [Deltaproteobacteria bacterium]MBI2531451.1 methionine--tRNA ligase [Deltaproteobacteria bacterium]